MSVGAIIVNYHTGHLLPALLDAPADQSLVDQVVIVNNSPEESLEVVLNNQACVRAITPDRNLGFGAAVNLGAAALRQPWWLVINPDARPLPGCIAAFVAAAEGTDALVAGPRAYWDDKCQWRLPPATGDSWWLRAGDGAAAWFSNSKAYSARLLQAWCTIGINRRAATSRDTCETRRLPTFKRVTEPIHRLTCTSSPRPQRARSKI